MTRDCTSAACAQAIKGGDWARGLSPIPVRTVQKLRLRGPVAGFKLGADERLQCCLTTETVPVRKIEHIENQIRELSKAEFAELRDWILDQDWQAWDAKIESDIRSGKLDSAVAEAQAEFNAGRSRQH